MVKSQVHAFPKAARFVVDKQKSVCKKPYYQGASKTTNNKNLSRNFTQGKRKMIIAFNITDNENDNFYNPQRMASERAIKVMSNTSNRFNGERSSIEQSNAAFLSDAASVSACQSVKKVAPRYSFPVNTKRVFAASSTS